MMQRDAKQGIQDGPPTIETSSNLRKMVIIAKFDLTV